MYSYKEQIEHITDWFPKDSPEAIELYDTLMKRWREEILNKYEESIPKPKVDYDNEKRIAYQELVDIQSKIDDLKKNGKTEWWLREIIIKQAEDRYLKPAISKYKKLKFLQAKENGKISKQFIDKDTIINNVKISDILGEPREKSQSRCKYGCPLHQEDTPSFVWYKNTNTFYCFGCHEGGNVITLYMKLNKCDFKTAIKELSLML